MLVVNYPIKNLCTNLDVSKHNQNASQSAEDRRKGILRHIHHCVQMLSPGAVHHDGIILALMKPKEQETNTD